MCENIYFFQEPLIFSQKRRQISRKSISLPDGGRLVLPIGGIPEYYDMATRAKTGARVFKYGTYSKNVGKHKNKLNCKASTNNSNEVRQAF